MHGYVLVRCALVAAVVYASTFLKPIEGHIAFNVALGLAVALLIVLIEARLRDAAVTKLLGGLLGGGIGLWSANAVIGGLAWADTTNTKVKFMHMLILVVIPYLGIV